MAGITCPNCGSPEMHPTLPLLLIRVDKVHDGKAWRSQCLVCADYYDDFLQPLPMSIDEQRDGPKASKGWF